MITYSRKFCSSNTLSAEDYWNNMPLIERELLWCTQQIVPNKGFAKNATLEQIELIKANDCNFYKN